MASDSTPSAPEGSTGLSGPLGPCDEESHCVPWRPGYLCRACREAECETIGEFCLLHGWPQRPIDFTFHFKGS